MVLHCCVLCSTGAWCRAFYYKLLLPMMQGYSDKSINKLCASETVAG
jgi:hypothetical protein